MITLTYPTENGPTSISFDSVDAYSEFKNHLQEQQAKEEARIKEEDSKKRAIYEADRGQLITIATELIKQAITKGFPPSEVLDIIKEAASKVIKNCTRDN